MSGICRKVRIQSHRYISGEYNMAAQISPDINPAEGKVSNHPQTIFPICLQLTALQFPFISPTPINAPVSVCVVEIGNPSLEAISTVIAVPNSTQYPRDGDSWVT